MSQGRERGGEREEGGEREGRRGGERGERERGGEGERGGGEGGGGRGRAGVMVPGIRKTNSLLSALLLSHIHPQAKTCCVDIPKCVYMDYIMIM